jgi:hypothetical protein
MLLFIYFWGGAVAPTAIQMRDIYSKRWKLKHVLPNLPTPPPFAPNTRNKKYTRFPTFLDSGNS